MLNVGDVVTVRDPGAYLRQMPAGSDWQSPSKIFVEGGVQGNVVGFTAAVVGEPRYVIVNFSGAVGHILEVMLIKCV